MLAELILLTSRGWRVEDAALRLAPGALVVIALRGALTGADWRWIALPLALSLPVHIADLARTPRSR